MGEEGTPVYAHLHLSPETGGGEKRGFHEGRCSPNYSIDGRRVSAL